MPTPVQSFFDGPPVWYDDLEIWINRKRRRNWKRSAAA